MSVIKFFDGTTEEDSRQTFKNGTSDFWDEMPDFVIEEPAAKILGIEFENVAELEEFYKLIDYANTWGGGEGSQWKPNILKVGTAWFPAKNITRNSNLRFVHMETYLANKDKYELVTLDEIKK